MYLELIQRTVHPNGLTDSVVLYGDAMPTNSFRSQSLLTRIWQRTRLRGCLLTWRERMSLVWLIWKLTGRGKVSLRNSRACDVLSFHRDEKEMRGETHAH